ncbi:hypothetical protein PHYPSEUDO_004474 [Phytophthora pseudosyringae]|uniref:Uncharacterized protein n=1 Tax=Phytophthora pseudosyringae TaxID=221518 RepID=A0A8T1WKK5_9STRA|nr:hypothetical protein PHYPSEUDO_004474 [Phytophthora pseudosyringae]
MARDRDSAGRLLRVLQDCELFHMEAAIAILEHGKSGIRSESLLNPSGGDDVDVLERTPECRVLSLSDHKRIARLQAALTTVANAYGAQDKEEVTGEAGSSRNLVCAVAGAVMMQSMRDCTASRTNCCIWGPQAEKLQVLLDWMVVQESRDCGTALSTCDYVLQLLLEWINPTAEKQNQLASCLTLFELLQRRRRKLEDTCASASGNCWLLGKRAGTYMDALRAVVERGTGRVADTHRVKPSKLGLIAMETLALLCGEFAVQYMTANEAAKGALIENGIMRRAVGSMRFVVVTLRQWHLHSTRRQFLGYALQHLQAYVAACDAVLPGVNGVDGDTTRGSDENIRSVLDALCWHWETTVPILCTRTDASSRIQKQQPLEVLARVLKNWTLDTFGTKGKSVNPEVVYAQVRYACVLMDSMGGVKGCSKAFLDFTAEVKVCFVFFFVQRLATATKNGNDTTVLLILKVLRTVLLPSDTCILLNSQDDEQELLSQLLRLHTNARGISGSGSQVQTDLELFIADFMISRDLFISELTSRIQDSHTQSVLRVISLVRTFLYRLDSAVTETPLYQHWRKQLTPSVLDLVTHENYRVCQLNVPRLTEEFLDNNSPSAAKTIEGLLFSRLAPLLVLRMLPRDVFGVNRTKALPSGREDLDYLNEYIDHQLQFNYSDPGAIFEAKVGTTSEVVFHMLARSVVDPLEFKEIKMLATECLSKFPPPLVMPFVLAYVVAFLREATPHYKRGSSLIVDEDSVPNSCGLVTAKLMVYYLNRMFSEDDHAYNDCDITSGALALLVQILGIPSVRDSNETLLTDLQRGCIDCIALILSRLLASSSGQDSAKAPRANAFSLMDLLIAWIFGSKEREGGSIKTRDAEGIDSRLQELLESMWDEARYDQLPLQVRICCCNVLLSTISRLENSVLASWKTQGFISRIALATESCSEEDVVAGGLQIIFSFLYKASASLSVEDNGDLQLIRICFEATATRLESTGNESVAMNGLKVVGALIGKLPGFIGTLPPEELQQLIDRCLITVRNRRVSPVVSELAQSLLQAMTPP